MIAKSRTEERSRVRRGPTAGDEEIYCNHLQKIHRIGIMSGKHPRKAMRSGGLSHYLLRLCYKSTRQLSRYASQNTMVPNTVDSLGMPMVSQYHDSRWQLVLRSRDCVS